MFEEKINIERMEQAAARLGNLHEYVREIEQ